MGWVGSLRRRSRTLGGDGCSTTTSLLGAEVAAAADDEDRLEVLDGGIWENNPVGSEVDAGSTGRWTEQRIEGRRRGVGGALALADSCWCVDLDSDFARSRIEGEGGGPSIIESSSPWSSSSPSLSPSSKSNILAKFNPTLGVLTNRFVSSAGVGVARVAPVAVKMMSFIAETSQLAIGLAMLRFTIEPRTRFFLLSSPPSAPAQTCLTTQDPDNIAL
jgi:hypothetical protein